MIPQRLRARPQLLELDLTRGVAEIRPPWASAVGRARGVPLLREVVAGLRRAAGDPDVVGLVAHLGRSRLSLAQAQEVADAVATFRRAGRPAVAWAETFGELGTATTAYVLATAFEEIWLQPSGDVGFTGVWTPAVFVRAALDRLGVEPQLSQRHEYKTAADTLTREQPTPAHREMAQRLAESAMEQLVAAVSRGRSLPAERVRELIDEAPIGAQNAVAAGLVDRLGYRDEVYADLRQRLGDDLVPRLVERYATAQRRRLPPTRRSVRAPVVAVVPAVGSIHLGRSAATPVTGASIGSDTLGSTLRAAGSEDRVRAVVLRVNSPGGSYVASDAIRREVLRLRESGTTVVASMGSVAASGGYYIAMPAGRVVAEPGSITGSIGVLGGKAVVTDALQRMGVAVEGTAAGRNAWMFSTTRRFTPEQWERVEAWLDRVYDDFTAKVSADRGLALDAVRSVARGRVWTGADAYGHGLVDELGGLEQALAAACRAAELDRDEVGVRVLPRRNLAQRLKPPASTDDVGAALWDGGPDLVRHLSATLGLPATGVLTCPVAFALR